MLVRSVVAIFLLVSCVEFTTAQVKYTKEQKALKKEADYYYSYGDYLGALKLYKKLYEVDTISAQLQFKIGTCMLMAYGDKRGSAPYFIKASDAGFTEAHYYVANWYHLEGEFEKAVERFQKYKEAEDKKLYDPTEIDERIQASLRAKEMVKHPVDVKIENIGYVINTKYSEYVPVISADESVLIFTSRREGSTGGKLDPYGQYFEDVYISYKQDDKWTPPKSIGSNINKDNHDACVALSADGFTLITYKTNESLTGGDLYYSNLEGNTWELPKKYGPEINSEYLEASASIASDGNKIYFSSNRPDGYGGKDIYRVMKLPHGDWSLPQNLGPQINTPYDDDAPFIHPDGLTLYFSSMGHKSMGGHDIFKSTLKEDLTWTEPENLGYPINTTDDDMYFVLSADGRRGYYSSGKEGGYGDQDIYIIRLPYEFKDLTIIKGVVTSADSLGKPLKAKITLRDFNTKKIEGIYHSNSVTGKYLLVIPPNKKFKMSVEAAGHYSYIDFVDFPEDGGFSTINKPIRLEKVEGN